MRSTLDSRQQQQRAGVSRSPGAGPSAAASAAPPSVRAGNWITDGALLLPFSRYHGVKESWRKPKGASAAFREGGGRPGRRKLAQCRGERGRRAADPPPALVDRALLLSGGLPGPILLRCRRGKEILRTDRCIVLCRPSVWSLGHDPQVRLARGPTRSSCPPSRPLLTRPPLPRTGIDNRVRRRFAGQTPMPKIGSVVSPRPLWGALARRTSN